MIEDRLFSCSRWRWLWFAFSCLAWVPFYIRVSNHEMHFAHWVLLALAVALFARVIAVFATRVMLTDTAIRVAGLRGFELPWRNITAWDVNVHGSVALQASGTRHVVNLSGLEQIGDLLEALRSKLGEPALTAPRFSAARIVWIGAAFATWCALRWPAGATYAWQYIALAATAGAMFGVALVWASTRRQLLVPAGGPLWLPYLMGGVWAEMLVPSRAPSPGSDLVVCGFLGVLLGAALVARHFARGQRVVLNTSN